MLPSTSHRLLKSFLRDNRTSTRSLTIRMIDFSMLPPTSHRLLKSFLRDNRTSRRTLTIRAIDFSMVPPTSHRPPKSLQPLTCSGPSSSHPNRRYLEQASISKKAIGDVRRPCKIVGPAVSAREARAPDKSVLPSASSFRSRDTLSPRLTP